VTDLDRVLARVDADFDGALERWKDFLRIPSVSTDPAHNGDVRRAAQWLADQLAGLDFDAAVRDTPGHPMVVAHHPGPGGPGPSGEDVPHLLYYGHYDVQPPDPVEEWDSGPFEPTLAEGPHGRRMVARGAVDDKGQLMTFVEAFRAWRAEHGTLPVKVTAFFEGEEESGSPSLKPFLEQHKQELGADVCVISDTGAWDVDTPALTTQLRGLLYTELVVDGPDHDLHSGLYGGAVPNPLTALGHIIGRLHDESGAIAIPGFYDAVVDPDAATRAQWQALDFDAEAFLRGVGVDAAGGECDRGVLEKIWARPSCDVNGMIGGYTGTGAKTVLPARASAKISFRLVPDQDPDTAAEQLRAHLKEITPEGCRWKLIVHHGAPAIRVPTDSPHLRAAQEALETAYGREPLLIGCGGSIPVVGVVKEVLGMDSLLMGFGLADDRMHSPNEKFELRCFDNGMKAHAALLDRMARAGRGQGVMRSD